MNNTVHQLQSDSPAWVGFTKVSFLLSVGAMVFGIALLPADFWVKAYFSMGLVFMVGSTISVSKTLRDQHESRRIIHKVEEAKTEKILKEYS